MDTPDEPAPAVQENQPDASKPIVIVRVKEIKRGRPKRRLLSIKELAEFLACSRTTIYGLLDTGCPAYRVTAGSTGGLRFDLPVVLAWLDQRRSQRQAQGWE